MDMSLSDAEAASAYGAIVQRLQELQFGWVVEQVESTIALGKPVRRRLEAHEIPETARSLVSSESPGKRRGAQPMFVVADEFSSVERLEILVNAVRAAVLQMA